MEQLHNALAVYAIFMGIVSWGVAAVDDPDAGSLIFGVICVVTGLGLGVTHFWIG